MKNRWRKLVAGGLAASMTVMDGNQWSILRQIKMWKSTFLSHRYAALEYYAQAMIDNSPENVTVNTELTTYGRLAGKDDHELII